MPTQGGNYAMSRTLLFFDSATAATGNELYATDGTAGGTSLVSDILPGSAGSSPANITALGSGGVVFTAYDGNAGKDELFVSDGTANGTVELNNTFIRIPVYTIHISGVTSSSFADFTAFGRKVLFAGATSTAATELWITDGTVAGTVALQDFGPNFNVTVGSITSLGGRAVFNVGASATQPGLWATDGTAAGTVRLSAQQTTLTTLNNGTAVTLTPDGSGGALLGVTDGTVAGTATLRSFPSFSGGGVQSVTPLGNGRAVFAAYNGTAGLGLWTTDGTAAGTVKLVQGPGIGPGASAGFNPAYITPLNNGRAVFRADDGTSNTAVWVTDGTTAGTALLADIAPGSSTTSIFSFSAVGGGKALFTVANSATGTSAVWATDGTAAGTVQLQTIPSANGITLATPSAGLANGRAVYGISGGAAAVQLYTTDGTVAGTSLIATLPGTSLTALSQGDVLPDGRVVFNVVSTGGATTLWATDGTAVGTVQLGGLTIYNTAAVATAADPDPLFDSNYYLAHNPDVAASTINAAQHYQQFGATEGRNPDPFFDSRFYLQQNPDVAAAGLNPLQHFEQYGWKEGRDPSLLFSTTKCLAANPDVAAAAIDPLLHYVQYGQAEGRMAFLSGGSASADPLVDPAFYDPQLGATLLPTGTAAAQQADYSYNTTGWLQGLNPDALFNTSYYLQQNPDVAVAGIDPLAHFEQYGWTEGRNPSTAFSTNKYEAANPDVAAARVDPLAQYIAYGAAEGRAIYSV